MRKSGVIVSSTAAGSGASGAGDIAGSGIQITDGTNTATAATDIIIPIELLTVTGDGTDTSLILSPVAANEVLAGPGSGSGATPAYRALVPLDLPVATTSALGIVKPDNSSITIASGVLTAVGSGVGSGTVTSVSSTTTYPGMTDSVSNPTTTPAIALTLTTGLTANEFVATPNGSAGVVSLRAIVSSDLPIATSAALGAVVPDNTSIGVSIGGVLSILAESRRWMVTFQQTVLAGIDLTQIMTVPYGTGNATETWTPKMATLYCAAPAAGTTTVQALVSTSGNAAFGAGTGILNTALSITGTSNYESTTSTMASGVTVASGNLIAPNWSSVAGSGAVLVLEFESAW